MKWFSRMSKIISVFFYGYAGGLPAVGGYIAINDPINLTLFNLFFYPLLAGYISIIPQLGKMFAEISNELKKKDN